MNVLIAYATTEGQTRKIAEHLGDRIRGQGNRVCVLDTSLTDEATNIDGFDVYILAGSLHYNKHQPRLIEFAKRHAATLQRSHAAFLSVSASAARTDEESLAAVRQCISDFIQETGWIPCAWLPVAGAMKYTKYNFILRALLKHISKKNNGPTDTSKDHEFTDWHALEAFVDQFLKEKFVAQPKRRPEMIAS